MANKTTEESADRAEIILAKHKQERREPGPLAEEDVTELLTELQHLCAREGWSFATALKLAEMACIDEATA